MPATLVALLLLLHPGSLHAQEGAAEPDPSKQLVQDALVEFQAGRWVEAYNFFKKAHATSPSARTLRGMGMTSYEMGNYPRALEELKAALASKRHPLTPELVEHVDDLIRRSSMLVGTLEIAVTPDTATVLVNGERTAKRSIVMPVGRVTVRAKHRGHAPEQEVVNVEGGNSYSVDLRLSPLGGAAPTPAAVADSTTESESGPEAAPIEAADTPTGDDPTDDDGSLAESPWLWVGVGVAVLGGVLATVLIASSDDGGDEVDPLPASNVGTNWTALRRW